MNSDSENFEQLRKLMALKRHEQPPPAYFDRLANQIAYRLEHERNEPSFWEKVVAGFTFRPAFAYSFALAAFGALGFSLISSVQTQSSPSGHTLPGFGWRNGVSDAALANEMTPLEPLHMANWMGSTNLSAAASALPSLFSSSAPHQAVPVSYATP
jgi:hypothetical protein